MVYGAGISSLILFKFGYLQEYGIFLALLLGLIADAILYWVLSADNEKQQWSYLFLLPFLYSFSWGLFFSTQQFSLPIRIALTLFYAFGLYAVFLCMNIFHIASFRHIQLRRAARSVSLFISLITLSIFVTCLFSLNIGFILNVVYIFTFSFLLTIYTLWVYPVEKLGENDVMWIIVTSIGLGELGGLLGLFPLQSHNSALLLTSVWYTWIGVFYSYVYIGSDAKRFFPAVREYVIVSLCILFLVIASMFPLLSS